MQDVKTNVRFEAARPAKRGGNLLLSMALTLCKLERWVLAGAAIFVLLSVIFALVVVIALPDPPGDELRAARRSAGAAAAIAADLGSELKDAAEGLAILATLDDLLVEIAQPGVTEDDVTRMGQELSALNARLAVVKKRQAARAAL